MRIISSLVKTIKDQYTKPLRCSMKMRSRTLSFILFLSFTVCGFLGKAQQQFPVKITGFSSVSSVLTSDYGKNQNFGISVTNTDPIGRSLQVTLFTDLTYKNVNGEIEAARSINGVVIQELLPGASYRLTDQDLDDLISDLNLPGVFGEGMLTWQFEAVEETSGLVVSNKLLDRTQVLAQTIKPVLLNLPEEEAQIIYSPSPEGLLFQWSPQSVNVTPGQQVFHSLIIKEYDPLGAMPNPEQVATAEGVPELFSSATASLIGNQYNYTPNDFPLEEGKHYVWFIQSYELINGVPNTVRFLNNGYSEKVHTLWVKERCEAPTNFTEELKEDPITKEPLIALSWDEGLNNKTYELRFRPQGWGGAWQYRQLTENNLELGVQDLLPNKVYEYAISATCKFPLPYEYGGEFEMETPGCIAPSPILVSQETDGIKLSWETPFGQNPDTKLYYKLKDSPDEFTIEELTTTNFTLAAITEGSYLIRLDAQCSTTLTATGKELEVTHDHTGVAGDCELPQPFALQVQEITTGNYQIEWTPSIAAQAYDLTYWPASDLNNQIVATDLTTNSHTVQDIVPNELYYYHVNYTCSATKNIQTPEGSFKFDFNQSLVTPETGTGNCFPPTALISRIKDEDIAKVQFKWDKSVTGANISVSEYQLYYYPAGQDHNMQMFKTNNTKADIEPLETGITYNFKVTARCNGDFSAFSDIGSISIVPPVKGKCEPVEEFVTVDSSRNEIKLAWKHDLSEGGVHPLGYTGFTIEYYEEGISQLYTEHLGSLSELETDNYKDGEIFLSIANLKGSTTYFFTIKAHCNNKKNSKLTEELPGTTKEGPAPCADPNACDTTIRELHADPASLLEVQYGAMQIVLEEQFSPSSTHSPLWQAKGNAEMSVLGKEDALIFHITIDSAQVNKNGCVLFAKTVTDLQLNPLSAEVRDAVQNVVNTITSITDAANDVLDDVDNLANKADGMTNLLNSYVSGGKDEELEEKYKDHTLEQKGEEIVKLTTLLASLDPEEDLQKYAETAYELAWLIKNTAQDGIQEFAGLDATAQRHIYFRPNEETDANFDYYEKRTQFPKLYEQPPLNEEATLQDYTYYVPYVAIQPSATYQVKAEINGITDLDQTKLKFNTASALGTTIEENTGLDNEGKDLVFTLDGNVATVTIDKADAKRVWAIYDGDRLGKLNIIEVKEIPKKVIIVPTGSRHGFDVAKIKTKLEQIYDVPNAKFTVEVATDQPFVGKAWDTDSPGLEVEDHRLMSRVSDEMKNIESSYFKQSGVDAKESDTYYLFYVNTITHTHKDHPGIAHAVNGYMPRNKKVGFISTTDETVISHELGHGMFRLAHTWQLDESQTQGTTDNLMDYKGGEQLIGAQWAQIQDPSFDIYGLDAVEDGESVNDNGYQPVVNFILKEIKENVNKNISTQYPLESSAFDLPMSGDRLVSDHLFLPEIDKPYFENEGEKIYFKGVSVKFNEIFLYDKRAYFHDTYVLTDNCESLALVFLNEDNEGVMAFYFFNLKDLKAFLNEHNLIGDFSGDEDTPKVKEYLEKTIDGLSTDSDKIGELCNCVSLYGEFSKEFDRDTRKDILKTVARDRENLLLPDDRRPWMSLNNKENILRLITSTVPFADQVTFIEYFRDPSLDLFQNIFGAIDETKDVINFESFAQSLDALILKIKERGELTTPRTPEMELSDGVLYELEPFNKLFYLEGEGSYEEINDSIVDMILDLGTKEEVFEILQSNHLNYVNDVEDVDKFSVATGADFDVPSAVTCKASFQDYTFPETENTQIGISLEQKYEQTMKFGTNEGASFTKQNCGACFIENIVDIDLEVNMFDVVQIAGFNAYEDLKIKRREPQYMFAYRVPFIRQYINEQEFEFAVDQTVNYIGLGASVIGFVFSSGTSALLFEGVMIMKGSYDVYMSNLEVDYKNAGIYTENKDYFIKYKAFSNAVDLIDLGKSAPDLIKQGRNLFVLGVQFLEVSKTRGTLKQNLLKAIEDLKATGAPESEIRMLEELLPKTNKFDDLVVEVQNLLENKGGFLKKYFTDLPAVPSGIVRSSGNVITETTNLAELLELTEASTKYTDLVKKFGDEAGLREWMNKFSGTDEAVSIIKTSNHDADVVNGWLKNVSGNPDIASTAFSTTSSLVKKYLDEVLGSNIKRFSPSQGKVVETTDGGYILSEIFRRLDGNPAYIDNEALRALAKNAEYGAMESLTAKLDNLKEIVDGQYEITSFLEVYTTENSLKIFLDHPILIDRWKLHRSKNLTNLLDDAVNFASSGLETKYINWYKSGPKLADDAYLDVLIHSALVDGKYKFILDGEYVEASVLAKAISDKLVSMGKNPDDITIRLLSCNVLEQSAQDISDVLNMKVMASDGVVKLHSDGGVSLIPNSPGSTPNWFEISPFGTSRTIINPANAPPKPVGDDAIADFIELGRSASNTDISSYSNIISKLDEIENISPGLKQSFLDEFADVSADVLNRIDQNSKAVEIWSKYTSEGQLLIRDNADVWLKHIEARSMLKEGNYDDVIELFDGTKVDSYSHNGIKYLIQEEANIDALNDAIEIINRSDDVANISKSTGVSEQIIQEVKQHFFVNEHLHRTSSGFEIGRFERVPFDISLWKAAENDFENGMKWFEDDLGYYITRTEVETRELFMNLITHEYIELSLIKKGMSFRSLDQSFVNKPFDFGAHDLAPKTNWEYPDIKLNESIPECNQDFSNIDEIILKYVEIFSLE